MNICPPFLYRYLKPTPEHLQDIFQRRRLHFAEVDTLNDPFDCAIGLNLPPYHDISPKTMNLWKKYFSHLAMEDDPSLSLTESQELAEQVIINGFPPKEILELKTGIRNLLKERARLTRVCCFSSTPRSPMMWAHYSDNHRGIVIQFDTRFMGDPLSNEIRCYKIKYSQYFPDLEEYLDAADKAPDVFALLFLCRKSIEWQAEKEWRFFTYDNEPYLGFCEKMVSGVIFGSDTKEGLKEEIKSWVSDWNNKPLFYNTTPSSTRFRMHITKHISEPLNDQT